MSKVPCEDAEVDRHSRTTSGPSPDDWTRYKDEIIEMYRCWPLGRVRKEMEKRHKFNASKRMYDQRFKQWRISKNVKREEKEKIARTIAEAGQDGNSAAVLDISNKQLKKVMRYVQAQSKGGEGAVGSGRPRRSRAQVIKRSCSSDEESIDSGSGHGSSDAYSPSASNFSSSTRGSPKAAPSESPSQEIIIRTPPGNQLDMKPAYQPNVLEPLLHFSQSLRNTEFLIDTVGNYFSSRLLCITQNEKLDHILGNEETSVNKRFWSNIENGIYLWKIGSSFPDKHRRALTALNTACTLAQQVLLSQPLEFIRRLFYTLSPTNTSIHPPLRKSLLSMISRWSKEISGRSHPLSMICSALLEDEDSAALSQQVLHRMYDTSSLQLGQSHGVSYKLMQSIITTTRRAGELDSAKGLAESALELARIDHGYHSEQARLAAKELANILACQGEHDRALFLRLGIVQGNSMGIFEFAYTEDSISIYAMEDIAEHYDVIAQDLEESARWLERAKSMALGIWGDTVTTGHISDKLEDLQERMQMQEFVLFDGVVSL